MKKHLMTIIALICAMPLLGQGIISYSFSGYGGFHSIPDNKNWKLEVEGEDGSEVYVAGVNYLQIGSKAKPFKTALLTHTALEQVTKVEFYMYSDVANSVDVSVFVGENQLGSTQTMKSNGYVSHIFETTVPLDGEMKVIFEGISSNKENHRFNLQKIDIAAGGMVGIVEPPVFSVGGGTFDNPFDLVLTASADATIHYTLDGSEVNSSSPVYDAPIALDYGTTTVKAIAINGNGELSEEVSHTYNIIKEIALVPATMTDIEMGGKFYFASSDNTSDAYFAQQFSSNKIIIGKGADKKGEFSISKNDDGSYAIVLEGKKIGTAATGGNLSGTGMNCNWDISAVDDAGHFKIINRRDANNDRSLLFFLQSGEENIQYHLLRYVTNSPDYYCYPVILKAAEATTGHINISSSGYSTFYSNHSIVLPEGLSASTVSGTDRVDADNYTIEYPWEYGANDIIPAQTAVLLKGNPGDYTYEFTEGLGKSPETNLLHGTLDDQEIDTPTGNYYYYKLAYKSASERILGFWWGAPDGGVFRNSGGKAYLAIPKSEVPSAARGFIIDQNTSSIRKNIIPSDEKVNVYSTTGILVRKSVPQSKATSGLPTGIYIIGGNKTFIK